MSYTEPELDAVLEWFKLHELLDEIKDPQSQASFRRASMTLGDAFAYRTAIQESLLVLAHSGKPESVTVLETYLENPHKDFEHLAKLALDEARFWSHGHA